EDVDARGPPQRDDCLAVRMEDEESGLRCRLAQRDPASPTATGHCDETGTVATL
ncbi:MAG: hypothetical protein AVDCRST_MAG71-2849, partial [uncultured Lysobacter sp.]